MDDSRPEAPRGRILLIDDDRVFGVWATKVLQARGFEIKHLLDPLEGLRQVEAESWDLVITDVRMLGPSADASSRSRASASSNSRWVVSNSVLNRLAIWSLLEVNSFSAASLRA